MFLGNVLVRKYIQRFRVNDQDISHSRAGSMLFFGVFVVKAALFFVTYTYAAQSDSTEWIKVCAFTVGTSFFIASPIVIVTWGFHQESNGTSKKINEHRMMYKKLINTVVDHVEKVDEENVDDIKETVRLVKRATMSINTQPASVGMCRIISEHDGIEMVDLPSTRADASTSPQNQALGAVISDEVFGVDAPSRGHSKSTETLKQGGADRSTVPAST